jgi:phospholipase/lecithinase/hemolysin
METLKGAHKRLFDAGARNFLFINLPPIERSPGMLKGVHSSKPKNKSSHAISLLVASYRLNAGQIYKDWNKALAETVRQFANANHSEITAMIFSSYDTFTNVLDDPVSCGFTSEDVRKEEGGIWYDHLHPTSRMHDIIAANMAQFLGDQFEFGFVED